MARADVYVRDTIWTYILPIGILLAILLLIVTDKIKVVRQWYCSKYLRRFSEIHNELTEQVKEALFNDLDKIDSNIIELRNRGIIRILEIGVGSGSNLKYYPQQCRLVVVDPTEYFKEYFLQNADKFPDIYLEKFVVSPAERLRNVPPCSVDVVVTTTVLCCVENVRTVLKEIQRVLVPGGRYYFLEHVLAPVNTKTWKLQKIANWTGIWRWLHEGCQFRPIDEYIDRAGFRHVMTSAFSLDEEIENNSSNIIKMISPHVVGVATK